MKKMIDASADGAPIEHAAIIALAIAGCRIAEIPNMRLACRNGELRIVIPGMKLSDVAGQQYRGFVFPHTGLPAGLLELCPPDGTVVRPFFRLKIKRIERVIQKASKKAFGNSQRVTSSCFRNNVASQLKFANWSPAKIAQALGHQSELTQKYYGRTYWRSRCSGWVAPLHVAATTPTRPAPRLGRVAAAVEYPRE